MGRLSWTGKRAIGLILALTGCEAANAADAAPLATMVVMPAPAAGARKRGRARCTSAPGPTVIQLALEPRPFCRSCHAPESDPARPPTSAAVDMGVACVTCHVPAAAKLPKGAVLAVPRTEAAEASPHPIVRSASFATSDACASYHEFASPRQPDLCCCTMDLEATSRWRSTSTTDASGVTATPTDTADSSSEGPGNEGSSSSTGEPRADPCEDAAHYLFLQFEGAVLVDSLIGVDNAPAGAVANPLLEGEYGEYTPGDRAQVLALVREHYSPFNVCVTDQRPEALDFDMLVVTSDTQGGNPNGLGFSDVDCGDATGNNVGVLFLSDAIKIGTGRKAVAVSKFAASFYGLESVGEPGESYPDEIMICSCPRPTTEPRSHPCAFR